MRAVDLHELCPRRRLEFGCPFEPVVAGASAPGRAICEACVGEALEDERHGASPAAELVILATEVVVERNDLCAVEVDAAGYNQTQ